MAVVVGRAQRSGTAVLKAVGTTAGVTLTLLLALGSGGCTTVLLEAGRIAREDRAAESQFSDAQIGAGIFSDLSDKEKPLIFDINVDVWEARVLLTGTVSDARTRQEVLQKARANPRVSRIFDEIQVVSEKDQARSEEGFGRVVSDIWIQTRIAAQLIGTRDLPSVNYRWRSVRGILYIIGRAGSRSELDTVLQIARSTDGVRRVKSFVEIKPVVATAVSSR